MKQKEKDVNADPRQRIQAKTMKKGGILKMKKLEEEAYVRDDDAEDVADPGGGGLRRP